jgi:hypothetical protein
MILWIRKPGFFSVPPKDEIRAPTRLPARLDEESRNQKAQLKAMSRLLPAHRMR